MVLFHVWNFLIKQSEFLGLLVDAALSCFGFHLKPSEPFFKEFLATSWAIG